MRDYPLISLSQVALVDDISFFGSSGILSLDIKGRDFTGTTAVLINGHRSPTFVVISDSRLLADVPKAAQGDSIKTLTVLKASVSTPSRGSIISFEAISDAVGIPPSSFLVQKVLKYLFTTRGSDIFSPTSGGSLLTLLGSNETAAGSLAAYARIYVKQATDSLIQAQSGSSSPIEEKVQSIEVLEVSYSRIHTSLDLRLAIISMAGQRVVAGLSV